MTSVVTISEPVSAVTTEGDEQIVVVTETAVSVVEIGVMGPQGIQGEKGDTGDTGPPGGTYRHDQAVAANPWVIQHDLGYMPAGVYVEDSAGTAYDVVPEHIDINSLTLTFLGATDGFALLS